MRIDVVIIFTFLCVIKCGAAMYHISLTHNGPVVLGAPITFRAELLNSYGERPSGTFKFTWRDNAIPRHYLEGEETHDTVQFWNTSYPPEEYQPGTYEVEVSVSKYIVFYIPITSERIFYNITLLLNGQMDLIQNNQSRLESPYVANNSPVNHTVAIAEADSTYLSKNATQVLTYWFVDCVYYGYTEDFSFVFNYNGTDKSHDVEALVVASFDPLPTPAPPTTTTTSTTTTPPTTTTSPTTTTKKSTTTTTTTTTKPTVSSLKDFVPYLCLNSTIVPPDPSKTVGYFHRRLESRAPVNNLTVTGNYWLKHGDMLNLTVACGGSPPYTHCFKIVYGPYNITGNETCDSGETSNYCQFEVIRYFRETATHTIVVIITNDVNKLVHPITINIYEVTKKAQLSVVVVPVVCTLIAVILIVFGVAFYVQSRRRFTVEVADFDFGQANDLEFKSFRERLREAFLDAFPGSTELWDSRSEPSLNRAPNRPIWTESSRNRTKYGNVEDE